jgi:hypothetical protein
MYKFYFSPFLLPSFSFILIKYITYIKARNIFLLLKIIFNLSLVLSLYIALLGLIFANNAFLALSLILTKRINKLIIPPGYK